MILAYSTWGMPTVPIETAVRHCAELGFGGLELAVIPGWSTDAAGLGPAQRRQIRELYDAHGLALTGFSGNVDLLGEDWPAIRATFASYLDLAADLQRPGERSIVTTTTGGPVGAWDARRHEVVARLGELAEYAAERDVMVGIEPHVAHTLRRPEDALWTIEQVANPAGLTLHFDISHFNVQGIPMEESIALLAPHALHTHIKDERGIWPDHKFLIPGEGEMDYPRYLRLMHAAGYEGPVVVEISIMVQRRPDYDPLAAATRSWQVLSAALAEVESGG